MKIANFICSVSILLLTASVTKAQVRRVSVYRPSYQIEDNYVSVYDYNEVDVRPSFPGGERGLINFINKTKEYPYNAYEHGIKGRVVCSFIINPDGTVCDIHIVKGVEESLNKEAIRIIRKMPKWKAGSIKKENVHVRCILPIVFRI